MLSRIAEITASLAVVLVLLYPYGQAAAQNDAGSESATATSLSSEESASLDARLEEIRKSIAALDRLDDQLDAEDGLRRDVLQMRLEQRWTATLDLALSLADDVAAKRDGGVDMDRYVPAVTEYLESLPSLIEIASRRVTQAAPTPDVTLPAIEQITVDKQFFDSVAVFTSSNRALVKSLDVLKRFEIDVSDEEAQLRQRISEFMSNASAYLDLAIADGDILRTALSVQPDDKELAAKLRVTDDRVSSMAKAMEETLPVMDSLDLETAAYRQQLLKATGQLSADVFSADVLKGLVSSWGSSVAETVRTEGPGTAFRAVIFLLVLFAFWWFSFIIQKAVGKALDRSRIRTSKLLCSMILSWSRNIVLIIGVLIALAQIGISLGPVLAGLGIAGFIVGFALQDSLANFASGMLIIVYRPFDVGDTVEVGGVFGKVKAMSLVNTTILTLDNQTLIVPNNKIWQDVIKNLTDQRLRRIDMTFGITYDQDIDQAERVLREVVVADKRVLEEPELNIRVHEFADSSVNLIVRPWVKTDDYWDVYWDLMKAVKQRFDAEGISIPFPQRDVHLYTEDVNISESPPRASGKKTARAKQQKGEVQDNDPVADEDDG